MASCTSWGIPITSLPRGAACSRDRMLSSEIGRGGDDHSMHLNYEILIITAMLILNAVFAAFEMALASISQAHLLVLVNQKKAGAASALGLKERMGASLAVIQVGMTVAGAIAAATGGVGVQEAVTPQLQARWH